MPDAACHDRRRLTEAARLLFPAEEVATPGFWAGLDPTRLKQAFRREVRHWHPDAPRPLPGWTAAARQARFVAVKQAYDLLRDYLREAPSFPGPRIIAVAGAKGGVGASIIAANLGVLLARLGRRVILADLDPAGPTLPLYLGNLSPHSSHGAAGRGCGPRPSRFGPALITGEDLGFPADAAAGLEHRRFLAGLAHVEADDLLCDLGSAPRALDLFVAARRQLLVTTCEPAAYVQAYAFLKRLRTRLSSQELPPLSLAPEFRPLILFNQVTHRDRPREMARRLKEVAARCLGLQITVLSLPFREEIAHSARDLVPVAVRGTGAASRHLSHLGRMLLT
ncbi:MAG: P-loop NTPase [Desulfobaccales bacterium]